MVKKLALVLALLMFSSPVFAGNDVEFCEFTCKLIKNTRGKIAYDLARGFMKEEDSVKRWAELAHQSTYYINMCNMFKKDIDKQTGCEGFFVRTHQNIYWKGYKKHYPIVTHGGSYKKK